MEPFERGVIFQHFTFDDAFQHLAPAVGGDDIFRLSVCEDTDTDDEENEEQMLHMGIVLDRDFRTRQNWSTLIRRWPNGGSATQLCFPDFGRPMVFNISFAFSSFSLEITFPLYFSRELSMRTTGDLLLFKPFIFI